MTLFLWNIVLAVLWAALRGAFTPAELAIGFGAGYVVLLLARPVIGPSAYYAGVWRAIAFAYFLLVELVHASLRVALQILLPPARLRPAILAVPLDIHTPGGITFFAHLVSLVPGTLSIDVSDDRRTLYIHFMDVDDAERARTVLKQRLEQRVIHLLQ